MTGSFSTSVPNVPYAPALDATKRIALTFRLLRQGKLSRNDRHIIGQSAAKSGGHCLA